MASFCPVLLWLTCRWPSSLHCLRCCSSCSRVETRSPICPSHLTRHYPLSRLHHFGEGSILLDTNTEALISPIIQFFALSIVTNVSMMCDFALPQWFLTESLLILQVGPHCPISRELQILLRHQTRAQPCSGWSTTPHYGWNACIQRVSWRNYVGASFPVLAQHASTWFMSRL